MEEILRKLQKDASGHKHKGIRDACVYARGECASAPGLFGCRRGDRDEGNLWPGLPVSLQGKELLH